MSVPPLLEVSDLSKTYPSVGKEQVVLDALNMQIHRSEISSLMGQSGSGKSTLLNLIGLLDRPTKGSILYQGESVDSWNKKQQERYRAKELGFVFQRHLLLPEFSLLENVSMPLSFQRQSEYDAKEKVMALLKRMKVDHRAHALPKELSGGESQRGAICRALIHNPSLLLMDEPTGNLDPVLGLEVMEDVLQHCYEHEMSCLVVTHNKDLAKMTEIKFFMENHKVERL